MRRWQQLAWRLLSQDVANPARLEAERRVRLPAFELLNGKVAGETRHMLTEVVIQRLLVEAMSFSHFGKLCVAHGCSLDSPGGLQGYGLIPLVAK